MALAPNASRSAASAASASRSAALAAAAEARAMSWLWGGLVPDTSVPRDRPVAAVS